MFMMFDLVFKDASNNKRQEELMALKKCKECGNDVSTKADSCPKCGAKIKAKSIGCGGLILVLIVIGIIGALFSQNSNSPSSTPFKLNAADVSSAIAEKKILIGMTADQVRASWGNPYKINSSMGAGWKNEQWVMHGIFQGGELLLGMGGPEWKHERENRLNSSYLYFENGILTSIQQSE